MLHKKRAGGVVQGVGPEFKSQYYQKKKTSQILSLRKNIKCNNQPPPNSNNQVEYTGILL
jgi:hypothetical protein